MKKGDKEEYDRVVELLDSLIEKYEDENIPEITEL